MDPKGSALGLLGTLSPRLRKDTLQVGKRGCLQFIYCLLPEALPFLFWNLAGYKLEQAKNKGNDGDLL